MGMKRRPGRASDEAAVHALLDQYSDEVRELALSLRDTIRVITPGASEQVYPGWRTISYGFGVGMKSFFCAIAPHAGHVNLQLNYGTELDDPKKLLEGTGRVARHVKIRRPADARARAVRDLIEQASVRAAQI